MRTANTLKLCKNWVVGVLLAGVPATLGCNKGPDDAVEQAAPIALPKPPVVTDAPGPYALRYFSATSGEYVTVQTPADVPEGARGQVLVAPEDPNLQGPWLFVVDLTKKQGAGYDVVVIDRAEIEKQLAAAKPAEAAAAAEPAAEAATAAPSVAQPPAGMPPAAAGVAAAPARVAAADNDVIIYRTSWCGYCKKAAQYLKMKGVKFVEKDLERDPGAREDMMARARRAGVPASQLQGVPILSVKGHVITGFDRGAIDRALGG